MKKKLLLLVLALVCAFSVVACGEGNTPVTPPDGDTKKPAESIVLDHQTLALTVGGSETLTATVTPGDTTDAVVWSTGDDAIVTVANGRVTAVGAGSTTVTATAGDVSATCAVTVTAQGEPDPEPKPATAIALDKKSLALNVGASETLTATVTPGDTTDTINWSSKDPTVAKVAGGVITAVGAGSTEIVVKAGDVTDTCAVTVESDIHEEDGYIWYEDFSARDEVPSYLHIDKADGDSATITEEGLAITTGSTSGRKVFVEHTFDAALTGTVRVEAKIKFTDAQAFHNILFFMTESGETAAAIAVNAGEYHNRTAAGKWGNKLFDCPAGAWQEIELILHTDTGKLDLYVGEQSVKDLPFCDGGDKKDQIKRFRTGGDKENIGMVVEYFKIGNVTAPKLSVTQPDAPIDLDADGADGVFDLKYEATSDTSAAPDYSVTCDQETGWTWIENNRSVRFSAAGTYEFTVTATDKYGSSADTITVEVTGAQTAPVITLTSETEKSVSLQADATYTFAYTVVGSPVPTVEMTCSREDYVFDAATKTATFFAAGVYMFTVTAENSVGTDTQTVTVTVTDRYARPDPIPADKTVYTNDFTTSDGIGNIADDTQGQGAVSYDDGTMHITTGSFGGSQRNYLFDMPFGKTLSGMNVVELDFVIGHDGDAERFTNLMFLMSQDAPAGDQPAACVAILSNRLVVHSGTNRPNNPANNWYDVKLCGYNVGIQKGVTYTLRAVIDTANNVLHLYISGEMINLLNADQSIQAAQTLESEVYLGTYLFRHFNRSIGMLRTGTNRETVDYAIDNVKVYQVSPALTVSEQTKTIENFEGSATYTPNFTAEQGATVTIACAGATVGENNAITFTKVGAYTVTITASNSYGDTVATVAVIVKDGQNYCNVDFTQDKSTEHITGKTSASYNGSYEFNDDGLRMYTAASSGQSIFYKYDMGERLTGVVTTEVGFMVPEANNHMINLLFWFDSMTAGSNQPTNYAIEKDETLRGNNSAVGGNWNTAMSYDGKKIHFIGGQKYTLKVIHDFDNNRDYVYLICDKVDLDGVATDINGEIYLATYPFRNADKPARVLSIGIDNKANVDFTLTHVKVYKSALPEQA